jgi:hypothetical protein
MANKHTKARTRKPKVQTEYMLHVLSNEPTSEKYDLMEMLHKGALFGTIGYMDAKRKDNGEPERLLVGLEPTSEGKFAAYPLARLLDPEETGNYLAPTGDGGWE